MSRVDEVYARRSVTEAVSSLPHTTNAYKLQMSSSFGHLVTDLGNLAVRGKDGGRRYYIVEFVKLGWLVERGDCGGGG